MAGTLQSLLNCDQFGDHLALKDAGTNVQFTYSALSTEVTEIGEQLRALGLGTGSVISMTFPNNVLNVKLFLAAVTSRMLAAPLNSKYKTKEFEFYLKDISSDVLVIPAEGNACAEEAALLLDIPVCTLTQSEDGHTNTLTVKSDPAGKLKDATPTEASEGSVDDKALFLHTSGTTGMPKGVPLTHRNLMATVNNIATHYAFDSKDCGYLVMPLFHVHGLMCGLLAPLSTGGTVVLPGNGGAFSATYFWVDFVANECTWYTAVPSIHQILLLRAPQDYPASNPPKIRFIRSCSSSLAPVVMQRLEQTFHAPVIEAYAMSEAAHMMTSNPLPANGPTKPGSVGVGVNVELTIRDDANNEVAQGQTGEVCVKGPNVTAGYHNRPEANQEAFLGGWFHTGDQGYLDAEGYLFLTGRIKELINRGGEKISPVEVDGILLAHPKVGEAVSFAAPHEILGEVVAAAVVSKANEQLTDTEVIDYCKQQLSAFKVPTLVFVVDDFPRTATGKIQRRIVAKHFLEKKE